MRESMGIPALRAGLADARDYTLRLYGHLTPEQRRFPRLRTVNPPAWELAHIGWFQEFWCLRFRQEASPEPARLPDADALLNSAIIPHARRWELPQLTWHRVIDYLNREFADVIQALSTSTPEQRYFFQLALLHEDMHGEALLMALQTLGLPEPRFDRPALPAPGPVEAFPRDEVAFEGGTLEMGSPNGPDFTFDNEQPPHPVNVAPFALSSTQVRNADYLRFVEAQGYDEQRWWTPAGWRWRNDAEIDAPRYWRTDGGRWLARRFDRWEALVPDEAVVHVNAFEAEAYCNFAGKRLPTEAEWEWAARAGLASGEDRYPWGPEPAAMGSVNLDWLYRRPVHAGALMETRTRTGMCQMLGNVWEWTATDFAGYPGFLPGHYKEYSQPWFGDHRVLRGGCFATRARLVHSRFRNFYTPDRNDIFAGFRTARSLSEG